MTDPIQIRRQLASETQSVVVKLGTQVLSDAQQRLDAGYLAQIAEQVSRIMQSGKRVTLVSSGAVAAGMAELGIASRPDDLAQLQAVAAVGQRRLMDAWADAFAGCSLRVAQLLLTREDIDSRARYLNLRNTLHALHTLGAVPVINENDTISTDELVRITFGDNDQLAASVAGAIRARLLVVLSVVDGVLDATGARVPMVRSIADAQQHLRPGRSALGKGGMNSKLEAARVVSAAGGSMIIAHGRTPGVLEAILRGEDIGTLIHTPGGRSWGRRGWISTTRAKGRLLVDAGAVRALVERRTSLLPAGLTRVIGTFERGDVVTICDEAEKPFARGLCNYSSADCELILGLRTSELHKLPLVRVYDEVIHRDNLVIDDGPSAA